MSSCSVLLPVKDFVVARAQPTTAIATMASTGSGSGDNTSSGGCTTPNSNPPNYDSDAKSDCVEEGHAQEEPFHHCEFCKQPLSDPRILYCLHNYCLYCLKNLLVVSADRPTSLECIKCHKIHSLPSGNLNDVPQNKAMQRFLGSLTFNRDDNLICRSCKVGNLAITRCIECTMFLCDMCTPQHGKLHCYSDHHVIALSDTYQPQTSEPLCAAHTDFPHKPTLYCYACQLPYCEAANHQMSYPAHKVVSIADSSSYQETMFSIDIEKQKAQACMNSYATGLKQLGLCHRTYMDDLSQARENAIAAINQRFDVLEQSAKQHVITTHEAGIEMFKCYLAFNQQLEALFKYLELQNRYALPWDNVQTRPFVEKLLKQINNAKPEPRSLSFSFELAGANADEASACLGTINLINPVADSIIPGYQQQPIARPTGMNRSSTNQNYGGMDGYQNANSVNSGFRQYSSFSQQQPQAYRSSTSSQSSDMSQIGYFGYEQRSQQRNSFDPFPGQSSSSSFQRGSSSPMAVSQPNSAGMLSDNVFDFNNLQLDRNDGANGNFYSSSQNQNRPYQTWSNGVDGTTSGPPMDDIFTRSSLFQVPDSAGGSGGRSFAPIKRTRMQFISKFGEYGNSQGQFTEPSGVAIDADNRLIVADTNNSRIQIFDIQGNFLSQFGSSSNNKLTYPNRIAVSKVTGKVVITERAPSHRVQTYTIDGQHLKTFGEDILQHPRGVAVDKDDNIIIIECKVMRVTIFSMDGQLLDQFSLSKDLQFPNSVAVNHRQEIFISDNRSHNVKVFSYKGALLRTIGQEGLTNYPIAVAINQRDQVVVADNHNNFNITVFQQDGMLVGGYESKTKHAQCFDLTVTDDGLAILTSKDFKVYCYPYQEDSPHHLQNQRR